MPSTQSVGSRFLCAYYYGILVATSAMFVAVPTVSLADDLVSRWPDPIAGDVLPYETTGLTHGPVVGRPSATSMAVWIRSKAPTEFEVVYNSRLPLAKDSPTVAGRTSAETDNTGYVLINGLKPNTRYHYGVRIAGQLADTRIDFHDPWPSFRTLPGATTFADSQNNPQQRFNVCFSVGCCASQDPFRSGGQYGSPPAFATLLDRHGDEIMFHIMNGDTTYEEERDGTLAGLRRNYKLYWSRGRSFSRLMRNVPMIFTWNDHEMGGNLDGSGEVGLGNGQWLLRDPGLKVWQEYVGWANYPTPRRQPIRFGSAQFQVGSDLLFDPDADFTSLRPETVSTIHIGPYTKPTPGVTASVKRTPPKNAGVYRLREVVDQHRLRIDPAPKVAETAEYSIGTHHYFDWHVDNCHFIALDTRGERARFLEGRMLEPDRFILGDVQREWFLETVRNSDAEFLFVISPDPWVIYHTSYHVRPEKGATPKGDGFASYVHEREILLEALDELDKPVLIFTGDVHNSMSAQISDNVWEFLCGPMGSTAHPIGTAGRMPFGGWWKSQGRQVKIKWVAGFPDNVHYSRLRNTYYAVVRVNNIMRAIKPEGTGYQFVAYDQPQVVVEFHDGYTGKLMYAEGISALDFRPPPRESSVTIKP